MYTNPDTSCLPLTTLPNQYESGIAGRRTSAPWYASASAAAIAKDDFEAAMRSLSALRAPVDAFFTEVTVNADDLALRLNRLRLLVLALILGLAVGALTSILQKYLDSPWLALVNSASPWLAPAFAVGVAGRRVRDSALAGLVVCAAELLGYYATAELRGFPAGDGILLFWTVCGVVGGPLFGAAGLLWREGSGRLRGLGLALLGGAFLAEDRPISTPGTAEPLGVSPPEAVDSV